MKNLLGLLLILSFLCGCGVRGNLATEVGISEQSVPEPVYTVYFPDDDAVSYSQPVNPGEMLYLEELIMTNTTEISVENTGNTTFECYLYYPERADDSIQTFTLEPNQTKQFGGLSSRYVYCIWFQSEESGIINAKISE